jgi:hypothetical protein
MKMTPSGKTHGVPMDPVEFRAKATGVGNTCEASKRTGMLRSERVAASSTASKQTLAAAGYPTSNLPQFADSEY